VIVRNYRSAGLDWNLLDDFLDIIVPQYAKAALTQLQLPPRLNRTLSL